jgi:hypothetical protein
MFESHDQYNFLGASSAQYSLSCRQPGVETNVATIEQCLHSGSDTCSVLLSRVICDIPFKDTYEDFKGQLVANCLT